MNSCPRENCVLYDKPLSNTRDTPEGETPNFYVYVLSRDVWSDHGVIEKEYIGDVRIAASQARSVQDCQAQCVAHARCKVISFCVMNSCPNENCVLYDKPLSNTRDTPEGETPNFYVYVLSQDVWSDRGLIEKEYIGDVRIAASQGGNLYDCQAQCVADARCKVISFCVMNSCPKENCVLYDKPLSDTRDTPEGETPNFIVYVLSRDVWSDHGEIK